MRSAHVNDRMVDQQDWADGINQFRLRTREELMEIQNKLDTIIEKLDEYNKRT